ncbi:hypothetical protein M407DRAFT_25262 [Tulasnella calospora MUT 4182]|uniref:Uncharacterized protein n=1 Tax=Tulasnella calospora MUT 4182 TaxID=1051891 RepID=A0A0C3LVP6_9AGAM|nr:hypothetical protein M407DRAFT_25262 [Tulasnella calospora MUT 4182]
MPPTPPPTNSHPPPTRYPKEFFARLTFSDLPSITLPCVLPRHSIDSFVWELGNPATSTNKIAFDEANGYDAVLIRLGGPVQSHICQYTISKIRLMLNIHNNAEAVQLASALSLWLAHSPESSRSKQALDFL